MYRSRYSEKKILHPNPIFSNRSPKSLTQRQPPPPPSPPPCPLLRPLAGRPQGLTGGEQPSGRRAGRRTGGEQASARAAAGPRLGAASPGSAAGPRRAPTPAVTRRDSPGSPLLAHRGSASPHRPCPPRARLAADAPRRVGGRTSPCRGPTTAEAARGEAEAEAAEGAVLIAVAVWARQDSSGNGGGGGRRASDAASGAEWDGGRDDVGAARRPHAARRRWRRRPPCPPLGAPAIWVVSFEDAVLRSR